MTGFPWASGDELDADDLNDAINSRAPSVALTNADTALANAAAAQTAANDAATAAIAAQATADAALPLSGGTMLGDLTLKGDPTAPLHAATKRYVDATSGNVTGPSSSISGNIVAFDGTGGTSISDAGISTSLGGIQANSTGSFFTNQSPPAVLFKVGDRLYGGAATVYNGEFPQSSGNTTWADAVWGFCIVGASDWGVIDDHSVQAITAVSQASETIPVGSQGAMGGQFLSYNPAATQTVSSWGVYAESRRIDGANNAIFGAEIDTANLGNDVYSGPTFANSAGFSAGLWVASGAGMDPALLTPSTWAIGIANNGSTFNVGINFHTAAITGTDGTSGFGQAIFMGPHQGLSWSNMSGEETARIYGTGTVAANEQDLVFQDAGTTVFQGTSQVFQVSHIANAVNGVNIHPSATGNPTGVFAFGSDANVALQLSPQGSAPVLFTSNITPNIDNGFSCGQSGSRWSSIWAANGTIQTSDPTLKTDIAPLPSVLSLVADLSPVTYKWKDGGLSPEAKLVEVDEPVFKTVTETVDEPEVQKDGTVRLVSHTKQRREPVVDLLPVLDATGKPVVDRIIARTVRNDKGHREHVMEDRPRMHAVHRTEKVTKTIYENVSRPGKRTHWGFLAPDVKSAFEKMSMDFGGYIKGEDGTEAIRPDQLIPVLWKAVQELSEEITSLKERLAKPNTAH